MIAQFLAGRTITSMSKELSVRRNNVHKHMKSLGIEKRPAKFNHDLFNKLQKVGSNKLNYSLEINGNIKAGKKSVGCIPNPLYFSKKERCVIPVYEFVCNKCNLQYDTITRYDETEEYPSVECPKCESNNKKKIPSVPAYPVGTRDRMERFDYRAGSNMDRAQGERRAAEAMSNVGANPYTTHLDDTHYGEGITHLDE